jgi:hypothetical protein
MAVTAIRIAFLCSGYTVPRKAILQGMLDDIENSSAPVKCENGSSYYSGN